LQWFLRGELLLVPYVEQSETTLALWRMLCVGMMVIAVLIYNCYPLLMYQAGAIAVCLIGILAAGFYECWISRIALFPACLPFGLLYAIFAVLFFDRSLEKERIIEQAQVEAVQHITEKEEEKKTESKKKEKELKMEEVPVEKELSLSRQQRVEEEQKEDEKKKKKIVSEKKKEDKMEAPEKVEKEKEGGQTAEEKEAEEHEEDKLTEHSFEKTESPPQLRKRQSGEEAYDTAYSVSSTE